MCYINVCFDIRIAKFLSVLMAEAPKLCICLTVSGVLLWYLVILFIINSKETFCRQQHSGPVVGIIECPKLQAIKVAIRALDDLPCVTIPSNARDNNYQVWNGQRPLHFLPFVFPLILLTLLVQALGWQATAGRTSMQRCAASTQWFNERISLAKYAHVRFSTSKYFS